MIKQAIPNRAAHGHLGALRNFRPVEADLADWAEQQLSVPLADDEYPHTGADHSNW